MSDLKHLLQKTQLVKKIDKLLEDNKYRLFAYDLEQITAQIIADHKITSNEICMCLMSYNELLKKNKLQPGNKKEIVRWLKILMYKSFLKHDVDITKDEEVLLNIDIMTTLLLYQLKKNKLKAFLKKIFNVGNDIFEVIENFVSSRNSLTGAVDVAESLLSKIH